MKRIAAIAALALWLAACPALAVRVEYQDGGILDCVRALDGEALRVGVRRMDVLARMDDGRYLLALEGGAYYAGADALNQALEGAVDLAAVPPLSATPELKKGSRGAAVKALQSALAALGYLSGTADGAYGNNTVSAVTAFRQTHFPAADAARGVADAATQLLALALADASQGEITLAGTPLTPQIRYPQIADRMENDISGFCGGAYALRYDAMEDRGSIALDQAARWEMEAASEIDRIGFEMSLELAIEPVPSGGLRAVPALRIASRGARRPFLTGCIVKAGDARYEIAVEETMGEVLGKDVAESALIPLGEEGLEMLKAVAEAGGADLRFTCKYRQFDVAWPVDAIPDLEEFADSAIAANLTSDAGAVSKR